MSTTLSFNAIACALALASLATACSNPIPQTTPLENFAATLEGDFNNTLTRDKDSTTPQSHARYMRVETPHLPGVMHYVEQSYGAGDGDVFRQRLYQTQANPNDSLFTTIYTLEEADASALRAGADLKAWGQSLTIQKLTPLPKGCEIQWRRQDEAFLGVQPPGLCRIAGTNEAPDMLLSDSLRLDTIGLRTQTRATTPDGVLIFEEATPNLRRRVHWFDCSIDAQGPHRLHDQGGQSATEAGVLVLQQTEQGRILQLRRGEAAPAVAALSEEGTSIRLGAHTVSCRAAERGE